LWIKADAVLDAVESAFDPDYVKTRSVILE
jgi:hypothetical protein